MTDKILTDQFEFVKFPKSKSPTHEEKRDKQVKAWNEMKKRSVRRMVKNAPTMTKKAPKKKKRAKLPKKPTLAQRKKALWELCKTYTKLRDGKMCVSCGTREGTQCGHFLPKSACNLIYKYYELNLGRQCSYCNLYLKGNSVGYRKYLISKLGEKFVKVMEWEYNQSLPLDFNDRQWVEEKIEFYKNLIEKYEKVSTL